MMSEMEIRTARDEDVLELAQLKSRHVRMVYRGFLPHPLLAYAVPDSYQDQFQNWLHQDAFHLDVLVKNGYDGTIYVDHVLRYDEQTGGEKTSFAYATGYMKGLMAAAYHQQK